MKLYRRYRRGKRLARIAAAVLTLGLSLALGGCGLGENKYTEPWNDAPRKGAVITDPVEVIANADGFSNLSTGCNHGNRWYVAYHADQAYAAIAVVAADITCPPGK